MTTSDGPHFTYELLNNYRLTERMAGDGILYRITYMIHLLRIVLYILRKTTFRPKVRHIITSTVPYLACTR